MVSADTDAWSHHKVAAIVGLAYTGAADFATFIRSRVLCIHSGHSPCMRIGAPVIKHSRESSYPPLTGHTGEQGL